MRVLRGQCLELGGAQIPYAPLIAALRPLARGLAGAEAEALPAATRNALAELLPELGGTGTREDDEPRARQGRVFEALLGLLDQLGRGEPVLLAIEDLHWADGGTRDFITFLVRSAREERVCLSSSPTAATSCTAATRCARCSPSSSAPPASSGSGSSASAAPRSPRSSRGSPARRRPAR